MAPFVVLLLLVAAGSFGVGLRSGRGSTPGTDPRELEQARRGEREARRFVGELRETVWQHREQAPVLADVLLDDIRRFEAGEGR